MKLFLDSEGKLNYDKITENSTVQDLLDAIDLFLEGHPLNCGKCVDCCCKKPWSVEMDNVCANRLCNWDNGAIRSFVKDRLNKKKNYFKEFNQYVLKKDLNCEFVTGTNFCTIYEQRPVICRLYICNTKSYRYNVIRELIGAVCLEALVFEEKMRSNHFGRRTINRYRKNPAFLAKDYRILLYDIIDYSQFRGWLDPDDVPELERAL